MNRQFTTTWLRGWILLLYIQVVSANTKPQFTNTLVSVSFPETTSGGTLMYTLTSTDTDGVTPFLTYTYDPTDGSTMFDITETETSTGTRTASISLKTYSSFDYETLAKYSIYVTANDGLENSDPSFKLDIVITDVNEPPTLSPALTSESFTVSEGYQGDDIGSPSFSIVDPDDSSHTWTITGGTGEDFVLIMISTGLLRLKALYDRDNASYPEDVYVNVTISDGALSVDVTFFITFEDANDNWPIFNPTSYSFEYFENVTQINDVMAVLTVSDGDITIPNNVITLSFRDVDSNSPYSDYFKLNGTQIIYAYDIDLPFDAGTKTFYVDAVDGGTPTRSAVATISLKLPQATTLAPTTTIQPPQVTANSDTVDLSNIGTDPASVALLLGACALAAMIIGYVLILSWRWHTFGRCLPERCGSGPDDGQKDRILNSRESSAGVRRHGGYPMQSFDKDRRFHGP